MGASRVPGEEHYLDRILKDETGHVILTTLIALPLIMAILLAGVEMWGITTIYQKAESVKYKTLSRMQVCGGLLPEDKVLLIDELENIGANIETINIVGDIANEESVIFWPESIRLRIEFEPIHFNSFIARTLIGGTLQEPLKIGVSGEAISEKIDPYLLDDESDDEDCGDNQGGHGHGHGHGDGSGDGHDHGHGHGDGSGDDHDHGDDSG